ncbi:hypothetical protein [Flavobacterium sp.]|uniref:hypothetical protein n=1 Tax=Flavobacterium sp. TaxID=239 RepID=UPI001B5BD748|nr:hypothetical protein [Flavobacterium sp.]MBP6127237.1 hypothetical protein [Flavobacterium sp.]
MSYSEQINAIYEHLKTSLSNGTFAKLTLGKTIGKTELTNIYFRTIVDNDALKFNVTFRYLSEEIIEIKPIEDVVMLLNQYLNNPFLTVILFTTEKDILIKLNKKRIATITEMDNTFKNADPVLLDFLKK